MLNQTLEILATSSSLPPENLLPWLNHEYSLTDKLKNEMGDASLNVIRQHKERPNWWDRYTLDLPSTELVVHREIIMSAFSTPCWYARTIIPEQCYQKNSSFFKRLNQETLGSLIFSSADIECSRRMYYSINASSLEFYWLSSLYKEGAHELWSRFSVFSFSETEIFYLVEVFLPGLLRTIIE